MLCDRRNMGDPNHQKNIKSFKKVPTWIPLKVYVLELFSTSQLQTYAPLPIFWFVKLDNRGNVVHCIKQCQGLDMGRRLCIFGFCRSVEMLSDVVEDTVLEHGGEV